MLTRKGRAGERKQSYFFSFFALVLFSAETCNVSLFDDIYIYIYRERERERERERAGGGDISIRFFSLLFFFFFIHKITKPTYQEPESLSRF